MGTPPAKLLLHDVSPWMMAGLLYAGAGTGLWAYRRLIRAPAVRLRRREALWLTGAVLAGGLCGTVPGPAVLGLTGMSASGASRLLNAEGAFTALLVWFIFGQSFDRRIALGMSAVLGGAVLLSWPTEMRFSGLWPALTVLGAGLAWGIDNNLTRKVSLADAIWIATVKGLTAGLVNLCLALLLGTHFPLTLHLQCWARHRAIGAVYATVTGYGREYGVALLVRIKSLAGVRRLRRRLSRDRRTGTSALIPKLPRSLDGPDRRAQEIHLHGRVGPRLNVGELPSPCLVEDPL